MKEIKFNQLRPDQIEVRPTDTKVRGKATLLLYIDSRSAADILNNAVGEFNWQIEYKPIGDRVFGRLSIWDEDRKMWIYKEDTGEESNIAAEKGLSSDILKRCLARWGCDYLYHTPRIKIDCPDDYYFNDKLCMSFSVKAISFDENKECTSLTIADRKGNVVFDYSKNGYREHVTETRSERVPIEMVMEEDASESPNQRILNRFCDDKEQERGVNLKQLASFRTYYTNFLNTKGWKGNFDAGLLWNRWMDRAY